MKKIATKLLSVVMLFAFLAVALYIAPTIEVSAATSLGGGTINSATFIIDPGHGGNDPGAMNGGRKEADDVLRLSKRVGELIIASGETVAFTRVTDVTHSLSQKSGIANAGSFQYLLSIHRNSAGASSAHGLETFYYNGLSSTSTSARLATSIQNSCIATGVWGANRGVKSANFHMVREPYMPSALIEVGFISNSGDNQRFDNYFEQHAIAIANGLLAMVGKSVTTIKTDMDGMESTNLGENFTAKLSSKKTGRYLTVDGANVTTAAENNSSKQLWRFKHIGKGIYNIASVSDGGNIDVYYGNKTDGTNVELFKDNGGDNQKMIAYSVDGGFVIRTAHTDRKVFDVDSSTGNVQIWERNSSRDQVFLIENMSVNGSDALNLGDSFSAKIKLKNDPAYYTLTGDSMFVGNSPETFKFTRNANGSYRITASSGKSLTYANVDNPEIASLSFKAATNDRSQQFFICYTNGAFYIRPNSAKHVVADVNYDGQITRVYYYQTSEISNKAQQLSFVTEMPSGAHIPIEYVNGSQWTSSSQFWTTGTFTAQYWGVLKLQKTSSGYSVIEKINQGTTKSVAATADNPLIVVHMDKSAAYAAFEGVEVGDNISLIGVYPSIGASFTNAYAVVPSKISGINSNVYKIDEDKSSITKVSSKLSLEKFLNNFTSGSPRVFDKNNKEITDTTKLIGTGSKVKSMSGNTVLKEFTVSVTGDLDGDGAVTINDSVLCDAHILFASKKLTGAYLTAADADGDGKYGTINDTVVIDKHLLGKASIIPR